MQFTKLFAYLSAFSVPVLVNCDGDAVISFSLDEEAEEQQEPEVKSLTPIGRNVLRLNSRIFHGNVLQQKPHGYVRTWVVLYCLPWFEPCEDLQHHYNELATEVQDQFNTGLFTDEVRFAQVDCATDRVLCNEQHVDLMPHVRIYQDGAPVEEWEWSQEEPEGSPGLEAWVRKILGELWAPTKAKKTIGLILQAKQFVNEKTKPLLMLLESSFWGQAWYSATDQQRELLLFVPALTIVVVMFGLLHSAMMKDQEGCCAKLSSKDGGIPWQPVLPREQEMPWVPVLPSERRQAAALGESGVRPRKDKAAPASGVILL